jgi:hypothetical protein
MAGVLSALSAPRHAIYTARKVAIELRLELELSSEHVNIAGQICSATSQAEGCARVTVVVHGHNGKVAETTTNPLGEFQLGFVPEEGLRMSFGNGDGTELSIPLDGTGMRAFL